MAVLFFFSSKILQQICKLFRNIETVIIYNIFGFGILNSQFKSFLQTFQNL